MESNDYLHNALAQYSATWVTGQHLYASFDPQEESHIIQQFNSFIATHPANYQREHLPGHFTGSALVVNKTFDKVLLMHHAKLNKWLQLGGHADGDRRLYEVAFREAQEESGI